MSRTEQNEHARSSGWLCGSGVPGGAAGREDGGTHHLLQPQRDDADEGKPPCLIGQCAEVGLSHKLNSNDFLQCDHTNSLSYIMVSCGFTG